MSTITVNNTRTSHRAHIVAEAVISAYIHELARPAPRPEPTSAPSGRSQSQRVAAHSEAAHRHVRRGSLARPRRWAAHELAA